MRKQGTPGCPPDDSIQIQEAVLGLLLHERPSLWSLSELDRTITPTDDARTGEPPSHVDVEDAVANLYAAGLIHRVGQFVFATRAAVEVVGMSL